MDRLLKIGVHHDRQPFQLKRIPVNVQLKKKLPHLKKNPVDSFFRKKCNISHEYVKQKLCHKMPTDSRMSIILIDQFETKVTKGL